MEYIGYVIGILVILAIFIMYLSNKIIDTVIFPTSRSLEEAFELETKNENFEQSWYKKMKKEVKSGYIPSTFGYEVYYEILESREPSKKWILFFHGFRFNSIGSYKYAKMFQDIGYNIGFLDHTNCGKSGGNMTTMGYREVKDAYAFYQYIQKCYGKDTVIGLHGESMGAATALLLGKEIEEEIAFVIADCAYAKLEEELIHQISKRFKLPKYPFIPIANKICKQRGGFFFEEIQPIEKVREMKASLPVFFIHGSKDNFTPTRMSVEMYEAKKGEKKLRIYEGAKHAKSYVDNKEEYRKDIYNFLEKYSL